MDAEMRIEGIEKLERILAGDNLYARPIQDRLHQIVREANDFATKKAGPIASSMQQDVSGYQGSIRNIHRAAQHVEVGRRPGGKLPPPDALREWAASHASGAPLFVLARAIARRGIRGRFYMRAARNGIKRRWRVYMKEIAADIGTRWSA